MYSLEGTRGNLSRPRTCTTSIDAMMRRTRTTGSLFRISSSRVQTAARREIRNDSAELISRQQARRNEWSRYQTADLSGRRRNIISIFNDDGRRREITHRQVRSNVSSAFGRGCCTKMYSTVKFNRNTMDQISILETQLRRKVGDTSAALLLS